MTTPEADDGRIVITVDGPITTVTVERPRKLNALTPELLDDLGRMIESLRSSPARVVLVRGAGTKAFCTGADIGRFMSLTPVEMLDWVERGHRVFASLATLPQATIAVLQGPALGGGLELALACDFRVAAANVQLGLPELRLGTVPGWGGTQRLAEIIGRARCKEVVVAGRMLDGTTAAEWGLITRCAPPDHLEDVVNDLCSEILKAGPIAVRLAKSLIDSSSASVPARILEQLAGAVTSATDDLRSGIGAFRAHQPPEFAGR